MQYRSPLGETFSSLAGRGAPGDRQLRRPALAGQWTPVSTNDCSRSGETIRFTGTRILYSVKGTRLKIGDILGAQTTSDGLELRYTAEAPGTPAAEPILPMRFLFKSERPDRMQAVAEGLDGQPLIDIQNDELKRVFDLKRCA